jgi:hypothetical protein
MRLLAILLGLSALAVVATVAAANGPASSSSRRKIQRSNPAKNRLPQPRRKIALLAYPVAFSLN